MYKSRAGMRLSFDDDKKVIRIDTPAGNSITLSEADKAIVLADQNSNKITLDADGIHLESAKALTLKAGTEVRIESGTSCSVKGGTELKLDASATTTLSGGMVLIN
jgi:hypothetical protein